jgi:putative methionine-R-sulfoxide reductase with GAF domain
MNGTTPQHGADGLLGIASLSRTLAGEAQLSDAGGLLWLILRQSLPCDAMALFLVDDDRGHVVVRYAAGHHAQAISTVSRPMGTGLAGAVALHWKAIVNGDPAFDLGKCAIDPAHPLRSCLAVPLVGGESLIAILALYSAAPGAFSDDHVRLLDLVAPKLAASLVDVVVVEEDMIAGQARAMRALPAPPPSHALQLVQTMKAATPAAPPRGRRAGRAARGPRTPAATQPAVS